MIFYFLYFLFSVFIYFVIHLLKFFSKKIYLNLKFQNKTLLNIAKKINSNEINHKKILLFHAASAGEFEQIKPILRKIDRSKYYIIQSFTSSTVYNIENKNKLFDISCYHPYDFIWKSYVFFKSIKPTAYIVSRHDIWPMHLRIAKFLNIKTIYINANLHKKSIWIQGAMRYFSKAIFKNIDLCIVPSESIKNKLLTIYPNNKIIIASDSRFSQVANRYILNKDKHYFDHNINDTDNIIFGSYDLSDLKIMYNALIEQYPLGDKSLIQNNNRIILVPHEINQKEINTIVYRLNQNNFTIQLYSSLKDNKLQSNIIIVDCIGILADIYKYAYLAYVGGGFTKGVHSILEPGVHGCAVCYGPSIELLDELKDINNRKLGKMIYNAYDLLNVFKKPKSEHNQQGEKIQKFILNKKQSANKIIAILEKKINE